MSWSKRNRGGEKRGYHHGNLRETLVEAALDLISKKGAAGFTFAEAARWAGVSPGAPYRHFKDRDELIADVASRGFEAFAAKLEKAWNGGKPDPFTAVQLMGRAYLEFARKEPAYYSAMFEAGLPPNLSLEFAQAADKAFDVLVEAAGALVADLDGPGKPPARMVALHIWSLSHGIASLFGRGDEARRPLPMPPEDLLEAGVLVYLEGLGIKRPA